MTGAVRGGASGRGGAPAAQTGQACLWRGKRCPRVHNNRGKRRQRMNDSLPVATSLQFRGPPLTQSRHRLSFWYSVLLSFINDSDGRRQFWTLVSFKRPNLLWNLPRSWPGPVVHLLGSRALPPTHAHARVSFAFPPPPPQSSPSSSLGALCTTPPPHPRTLLCTIFSTRC